ncbi:hypothetical protein O181_018006 [Austropuccinia psidii MF-1]|uniref:Uncharacterized protein n=1 Tax=Austropuccinia psidii MF-1 TaxID=1389203 RepID=A0A9Q3C4F7_9BASI|nr:hypothetical protein [Austropuccinia psidii MF-1]
MWKDLIHPFSEHINIQKAWKLGKKLKNVNELLDRDDIRKIGHNEIWELTTTVLITWHDGKSRLCGYCIALNNYTKADSYPIPRIPHSIEKLEKAK